MIRKDYSKVQYIKSYYNKLLILGAVLFGMIVLIGGQIIIERVFTYTIPVSIFITLGGGIYFLFLLLKGERV